jgi:transposase-like protein
MWQFRVPLEGKVMGDQKRWPWEHKIDQVKGSAEGRELAKVVLATLIGQCSVEEACERLGLSKSAFEELRQRATEGMLTALAENEAVDQERRELLRQMSQLDQELAAARERKKGLDM